MHVMEPVPKRKQIKRSKRPKAIKVFAILVVIVLGGYVFAFHGKPGKNILGISSDDNVSSSSSSQQLRFLSGYEFQSVYEQTAYPNTGHIITGSITGNTELDARILQIAESRGYKKHMQPVQPLEDFRMQKTDPLLQPMATENLTKLLEQSKKDGIPLVVQSGYRSVAEQKDIFLKQLALSGITSTQNVSDGSADVRLLQAIEAVAPPGYSRLQTGYAVAFSCGNTSGLFRGSSCATWLKANNYSRTKQYGYIPSYYDGVGTPDTRTEAEYVWVGTAKLYQ